MRTQSWAALSAAFAVLLVYLIVPSAASAARGHEFKESLGTPCTPASEPCAPGTLKEPVAVARGEETGDLYVADKALNRVTVLDSTGALVSEITGPSATGEGELTSGSATVTGLVTATGAFIAGEEITAPGIPAFTTIESVAPGELTLSAAATATEALAALSAHQDFLPLQGIVLDNACARHVPSLSGAECESFDPSGGDIYVVSGEDFPGPKVIDKFTVAGEFIGQITGFSPGHRFDTPLAAGTGVAVGPTGGLWVLGKDDSTKNGIGEFDNARLNQPTGQFFPFLFANTPKAGFALDPAGGFYLHYRQFGEHVAKLGPAAEKLAEREFPAAEAPTGLATDPAAGDLYVDTGARVERFAPGGLEGTPVETFAAPAQHGAGLTFDAATQGVYLADPAAGVIDLFSLQQPARPSIESLSLADVTGDSATLGAEVNPRGEPTTYRFEYGPCATPSTCATSPYDHTAPVPDGQLPGDFEVHTVSIHPQGLQPATAYHFRVVAENPLGTSEAEKTFTTQPAASLLLPDSRRWELVSPPDKLSGQIETLGGFNGSGQRITQAAAAGGALTYTASAPTEAGAAGYSNQVQILSARGPSGWVSRDIPAPHPVATGLSSVGNEYTFFSSDLSASVLQPLGAFEPSLSPQATEQTPFLRSDFPAADPGAFCASSCYRPLVTAANVPPGTVFGRESGHLGRECPPIFKCGPITVGATPDLSHLVLEYLSAGLTATRGDGGGLYEWSAAAPASEQLRLLSVLPDGEPAPVSSGLGFGSFNTRVARNAVSPDGSKVFFRSAFNSGENHLYLRLNALQPQSAVSGTAVDGSQCTEPARACTIELDALQGGSGSGGATPEFQLASLDGEKAFFTDTQALTPDSGATGKQSDLYEYDLSRPLGQRLVDLTPETPTGESAGVRTWLVGASADGSYAYFVAEAALAPGAHAGRCGVGFGTERTCNLYLRHAGATSLIASLPELDHPTWEGAVGLGIAGATSRVSPDGRYLAFMSQAPLTGYDNRDAATGRPDEEVFLYHAPASGAQGGSLVCASCNPTGARPRGAPFGALVAGLDGIGAQVGWGTGEQGIAASLPGWTTYENLAARYQPRYLSDGGRLFFNAVDSLVPGDSNNTGDVYQYEPPKGGEAEPPSDSCTTASPTYSPKSGGCVDLISSGTSAAESGFLDASESGQDVFFFTNAKLSSSDVDSARDVYDAHACTASSPCPPPAPPSPPACSGDACQAPAAAPGFESPGTSLINGPENLTECPKGKKLQKGKCVKQKGKKKNNGHKKKGKKHRKNAKKSKRSHG